MLTTIRFTLGIDNIYPDEGPIWWVTLKQPVGDNYETATFEVSHPRNDQGLYKGPWNHAAFAAVVEKEYRKALNEAFRGGEGKKLAGGRTIKTVGAVQIAINRGRPDGMPVVELHADEAMGGPW